MVEQATSGERRSPEEARQETAVVVVFFDDMQGSTVLKERLAASSDEQAFQILRKEHDALLTEIITRDGAGEIVKSTGDGFLAVLFTPSVAVERAVEIQERLHGHPYIKVRIGMDLGEVSLELDALGKRDVFGRHVDWAARATSLADAGHISVTRAIYTDAQSWIRKTRIAWKEHGPHRLKEGEVPLEIFEPFNANVTEPMEALRGQKVVSHAKPDDGAHEPLRDSLGRVEEHVRLARSWEAVARDGRDFAQNGGGMMYWFKVPLGGVCYPEGFRNFLQPALENPSVGKIRFMLDSSTPKIAEIWDQLVLPLLEDWAQRLQSDYRTEREDGGGVFRAHGEHEASVAWVLGDLSQEFTPCFKLFVRDPDTNEDTPLRAQIFLATATRTVRFKDGSLHPVRIPDAVLRVESEGNEALLQALNVVANQWDALFP